MNIFKNKTICKICFPKTEYNKIIDHCLRKLNGQFLEQEVKEKQAYGFVAGKIVGEVLLIAMVVPLFKNFRRTEAIKEHMNNLVIKHAIVHDTPIEERGWAADPSETKNALKIFQQNNLQLAGAYHMHYVNFCKNDEPTNFDKVLASNTELLMFIVRMSDPKKPVIRAFYEGCLDKEVKVIINK